VDHRRFLARPEAHRPFAGDDALARAGGRAAVDALVDGLYDRIEGDAVLRPLFGRDLSNEREAQKRFFTEWLGGEGAYTERAHVPIAHRHDLLPITGALAGKWLSCFRAALEEAVSDAGARRAIYDKTRELAMALVDEAEPPSALRAHPHGICLRHPPAIQSLDLARRGDSAALRRLLDRSPEVLASAPHAAMLLQLAVLGGRRPVVELLLDAGVDVNKPAALFPLVFVTPLCAARARRRGPVETLLSLRGAKDDIFTHAFLGDLPRLEAHLARDPSSAQATDPAVDALAITPVHHAVAAGQPAALRMLLAPSAGAREPVRGGARALREAAARGSVEMVAMLLDHGVGASSIGAGRWVLHPALAPMLARAGAHVDPSGSWIGLACTGNKGRKDDPDFVAALLRHGARVTDKRLTGQGSDGGRATALHYAAKAGFVKTVALLLEHGADPRAEDDNGLTPLDWLARAAKSVDRAAVRRLLAR
jgi:truncated hemoglobin YjbI/ankyrin repeat protein